LRQAPQASAGTPIGAAQTGQTGAGKHGKSSRQPGHNADEADPDNRSDTPQSRQLRGSKLLKSGARSDEIDKGWAVIDGG
jgi:hypothetical protein